MGCSKLEIIQSEPGFSSYYCNRYKLMVSREFRRVDPYSIETLEYYPDNRPIPMRWIECRYQYWRTEDGRMSKK